MLGQIKAAVAIVAVAMALPCAAVPIPVGTTVASDLIINFAFPPSPPYDAINVVLGIGGWDVGETITFDVFSGLNGANRIAGLVLDTPSNFVPFNNLDVFLGASIADGQFSIGVRLDAGAADLSSATAGARNAAGAPVTTNGVPVTVPEPATLALVGLGLAGLGFARRKPR